MTKKQFLFFILLTNEEIIFNSLYAVYKDLGINAGHVKIICEI